MKRKTSRLSSIRKGCRSGALAALGIALTLAAPVSAFADGGELLELPGSQGQTSDQNQEENQASGLTGILESILKSGTESDSESESISLRTGKTAQASSAVRKGQASNQVDLGNYIYTTALEAGKQTVGILNPESPDGAEVTGVRFETWCYDAVKGQDMPASKVEGALISEGRWETVVDADQYPASGDYTTRIYLVTTPQSENTADPSASSTGDTTMATQIEVEIGTTSCHLTCTLKNQVTVPAILQNPELPTGCESVALTIALSSLGFELEKTTIADTYLPYGKNFATSYVGDPHTYGGAGCFPPALVHAANKFLSAQGSDLRAKNISGKSLEELYSFIDEGKPVVLWTTMYMDQVYFGGGSAVYGGVTYRWYNAEHCVVLYGYDRKNNKVLISDPLEGYVERDVTAFQKIYDTIGQYALIIE